MCKNAPECMAQKKTLAGGRKIRYNITAISHAGVSEWQTMRTQNPLVATPCGFKSHHRHQTNIIRTYFQSVMGSDYLFSLTATKPPTSATGCGAGPPLSREAHEKRKQPHKRKKGGRSRLHGAPALFVTSSFRPPASPFPSASSIRQIPAGPPRSRRKRECPA